MKIRVGITDENKDFLTRFSKALGKKYDDMEILIFPDLKSAQTAAYKSLLDLLLLDFKAYSNYSVSIPASCKLAFLTDDKKDSEENLLPAFCRYQSTEDWHRAIFDYCGFKGDESDKKGGEDDFSCKPNAPVCLFLSCGGAGCASGAANAFCRFLYEKGFKRLLSLSPFSESGEDVWDSVEILSENCDFLTVSQDFPTENNIVIPVINSDFVVFVTDGEEKSNKRLKKLFKSLPTITGESQRSINEKALILYNGFDKDSGNLFENADIVCIGGLDSEENKKAAFEELIILCTRK